MPTGVSPVAIGVAVAALAAAVLMLLTEVTTVISIDVAAGSCDTIYDTSPELADDCEQTGFERSSVALLLLGLSRSRWDLVRPSESRGQRRSRSW